VALVEGAGSPCDLIRAFALVFNSPKGLVGVMRPWRTARRRHDRHV